MHLSTKNLKKRGSTKLTDALYFSSIEVQRISRSAGSLYLALKKVPIAELIICGCKSPGLVTLHINPPTYMFFELSYSSGPIPCEK